MTVYLGVQGLITVISVYAIAGTQTHKSVHVKIYVYTQDVLGFQSFYGVTRQMGNILWLWGRVLVVVIVVVGKWWWYYGNGGHGGCGHLVMIMKKYNDCYDPDSKQGRKSHLARAYHISS